MDSQDSGASGYSPEQVYDQTRRAKGARRKPTAFDRYWDERNLKPDKRFLVESNAFERALLKYLAAHEEKAVHVLARELIREAALRRVLAL